MALFERIEREVREPISRVEIPELLRSLDLRVGLRFGKLNGQVPTDVTGFAGKNAL
jgi:hypothetical protein